MTNLPCKEFSVYNILIGFEMFLYEEVHCVVIDEGFFCIERVRNTFQAPSFALSPYKLHALLTAAGGQHVLQTFLVVLCIFANVFLEFFQGRFSAVTVEIYVFLIFWHNVNSNPVATLSVRQLFVDYVQALRSVHGEIVT